MQGIVNIISALFVANLLSSNYYCVILHRLLLAPIAQQVERIHGKDEVSGSNPDGGSIIKIPGDYSFRDLFYQIYIITTPAASVARHVPTATVRSDLSKSPRIRATAKPNAAVTNEPVE